jgi:hypothetical protein
MNDYEVKYQRLLRRMEVVQSKLDRLDFRRMRQRDAVRREKIERRIELTKIELQKLQDRIQKLIDKVTS